MNYFKLSDSDKLDNLFKHANDKLVVVMYYSKHNPICRSLEISLAKISKLHPTTIFCIIEMDNFRGDSIFYIKSINDLPTFLFYHLQKQIGSGNHKTESEFEFALGKGENYVLTQNNNNRIQKPPINNPHNVIIEQLKITDPVRYNHYLQHPQLMQQYVSSKISEARNIPLPTTSFSTTIPTTPSSNIPQPIGQNLPDNGEFSYIPTMQQLRYMLEFFKMMQQMGVLNLYPDPEKPAAETDTIVLSNGDKLVPLGNGKFGRIRAKNNQFNVI